jgi:hypothetical protein
MTTNKQQSRAGTWLSEMMAQPANPCHTCTVGSWGACYHLEYGKCKHAEPEKIISVRKSLVTVIVLLMSAAAFAQPAKVGYWVVTDTKGQRLEIVKTPDMPEVAALAEAQFPGNCFEIEKELYQWPPVFSVDNGRKAFYVELKRITPKGKYRRISKREFKRTILSQQP